MAHEHPVHHITLTVTDLDVSEAWYHDALGRATVVRRAGNGWERVRMQWSSGLVIGLTRHHDADPGGRFDPRRVGLDHIGIRCSDQHEVRAKAVELDDLGIEHGPVEAADYGWAVTARDPDGIAVEFFAALDD